MPTVPRSRRTEIGVWREKVLSLIFVLSTSCENLTRGLFREMNFARFFVMPSLSSWRWAWLSITCGVRGICESQDYLISPEIKQNRCPCLAIDVSATWAILISCNFVRVDKILIRLLSTWQLMASYNSTGTKPVIYRFL